MDRSPRFTSEPMSLTSVEQQDKDRMSWAILIAVLVGGLILVPVTWLALLIFGVIPLYPDGYFGTGPPTSPPPIAAPAASGSPAPQAP